MMFHNNEVRRVKESFDLVLARMQQLAGVPQPTQQQTEVTIQPVVVTGVEPADETASGVHYALDEIERLIPKVQVKDLKGIRQRINGVTSKMSETRAPGVKSFRDYLGEAKPVPPSQTIKPTYAAGGTPPQPSVNAKQASSTAPQPAGGQAPQTASGTPSATTPDTTGSQPTSSTNTSSATSPLSSTSMSNNQQTTQIGKSRSDAVKSLADRLGGDQQAAGRMFDTMQKDGSVTMRGGSFEMKAMDDDVFNAQATLAKQP